MYNPSHGVEFKRRQRVKKWRINLRLVADVVFEVEADDPAKAKRKALDVAREAAAQASASVKLSDDVERQIAEDCDWSFSVPNRKGIPTPRLIERKG